MRQLFVVLSFIIALASQAQVEVTTVGTDFWFGFMQNADDNTPTFSVFISSQEFASGIVEMPLTGWSETFVTTPGVTTTVEVPVTAEHLTSGVLENKGIHIESDAPISVYCINYSNFTSDGTRILPTQFLDIEYIVSGYLGLGGFSTQYMSEMLIVATADDTELLVTPSCDMLGGATAGVTFTLEMDAGETYQLQAADTDFDITGTLIEATEESGECRPFAVFGGSECPYIPVGCSACDHVFDQAIPSKVWGTEYFTVPLQGSSSYTYRVLAIEDGTNVSIDGVPTYVLNSTEYVEVNSEPNALFITANNPISVIQYMEGTTCATNGDPAMLTLNSTNQTMDEVTFATVVSGIITNHNLNIVVGSGATGSVFLDGVLVAPAEFSPFPGNPAFSYAQVGILEGSHTLECDQRFVAYVYGTGNAESYAYSTGAKALEPLEPVINVTCTDGQVVLQSTENYLDAWWSTEANPNDTVFVGQPFIIDPPIPNELYVLHGNALLSGCPAEEFFSVESPEELIVSIVEDQIDLCLYQEYTFYPSVTPDGNDYVYSWTNENSFTVNDAENGVISPFEDGYYYLNVSTLSECSQGMDSVYVDIIGDDVTFFDAVTDEDAYCAGDTVFLEAVTGVNIANDLFSGVPDPAIWADLQGETLDNICGSMSGNAVYFDGAGVRSAETVDYDMTDGGLLSFAIQIADGSGACDGAEFGENVIVQYSTNGGGAWTDMQTLFEGVYPTFTQVGIELPLGAQTAATRFRWTQPVFSGAAEDIWMLDNVSINSFSPSGFPYLWTSNEAVDDDTAQSTFVIPTTSDWYYVSMNSAGCDLLDSVFVEVQSNFSLSITNDTTLCTPDDVQLSVVPSEPGNYTYLWDNGATLNSTFVSSPTATPVATTTYSVDVTSSAGCVNSEDVTITLLGLTAPFITTPDPVICQGTSELMVNVAGNPADYTFAWTPANLIDDPSLQTVISSPTQTTTFTVFATDTVNSCTSSATIEIVVNDVSIQLPNDTVLCDSEGLQIVYDYTSSGFESFEWNNAGSLDNAFIPFPTITVPDFNGDLIVTLDDFLFGCTVTDTMSISTEPVNYNAPDTISNCPLSLLNTSISGDFVSISWTPSPSLNDTDPSNPVFSNTIEETFYYNMVSQLGCSVDDSVHVVINLPDVVEITGDTLCAGETILLDCSVSGMTYLWNTTEITEDINITDGGLYSVNVIDSAGCVISDDIFIEQMPLPAFEIIGDNDLCIGEPTELTANITDVDYIWNNAAVSQSETFDLFGPQVIWAEVTDIMGCVYRDSIDVIWRTPPALLIESAGSICEDTGTVITATADMASFLWETTETTPSIFVTDEDYYTVTITDQYDCVNTDSIFIQRIDFPLEQELDTFFCEGSVVVIFPEVFPGFDVSWSTGNQADSLIVGIEGDYQMILTNENCVKKYPLFVAFEANPELELSREGIFCELDIFAGIGYPIYAESDGIVEWQNGLLTDTIFPVFEEGIYTAIAYSELGCTTYDSILVPNQCTPNLFAPSAFTPDNDGVNDLWKVVASGEIDKYKLVMFDRWGNIVFEATDPDAFWNGSVNGGNYYAEDGVYNYVITYEAWNNVPELISEQVIGQVTIIR